MHIGKQLQLFFPHPTEQQGSFCCRTFLTVTQIYHSKVTPICTLHVEKIAEAVVLYVFTTAFPASPPIATTNLHDQLSPPTVTINYYQS